MKLTKPQLKDLETIKYFRYPGMEKYPITEEDIKLFFENSEKGMHKEKLKDQDFLKAHLGLYALIEGKRWRGIHIHELYEPGILDGTVPYYVLLGGQDKDTMPRIVVDFLKKEMFKGHDSDLIEEVYQQILDEKTPWYKKIFYKVMHNKI